MLRTIRLTLAIVFFAIITLLFLTLAEHCMDIWDGWQRYNSSPHYSH